MLEVKEDMNPVSMPSNHLAEAKVHAEYEGRSNVLLMLKYLKWVNQLRLYPGMLSLLHSAKNTRRYVATQLVALEVVHTIVEIR